MIDVAKIADLPANAILAIPLDQPERLFPNEKPALRPLFARLMEHWHPDRNPTKAKADAVSAHLTRLYHEAQLRVENGTWREPNTRTFIYEGRTVRFRYLREHDVGYQTTFVGSENGIELLSRDFVDLRHVPEDMQHRFIYASPRMRETLERCMPKFFPIADNSTTRVGVRFKKTTDVLLLRDVSDHFGGKLDRRHIWWICSRLMNLACYLEFIKVAHNNIGPDTCYISPPHHSLCLFGGWWFAQAFDNKMVALPARTLAAYPSTVRSTKVAFPKGDRILIRRTICELLGDASGMSFRFDPAFPKPIERWLNLPFPDRARDDYAAWTAALEESFGARRFTEMKLSETDLYH